MPSTYAIIQPMYRADFATLDEAEVREMMAWQVTEQARELGYTPTARPAAVDWHPMNEAEAAFARERWPEFGYQRGDMMLRARVEIAETVDPITTPA